MTRGRKLAFYFAEQQRPMLSKTVFIYCEGYPRHENSEIEWMAGARSLSLFLIDYLIYAKDSPKAEFSQSAQLGDGSHLHTLAGLLETMNAQWLVHCFLVPGDRQNGRPAISGEYVAHRIFKPNRGDCRSQGRARRHGAWRRVRIQSMELPPDCVDITWDGKRVISRDDLKRLRNRLFAQTENKFGKQSEIASPRDQSSQMPDDDPDLLAIIKQASAKIRPVELADGVCALAQRACSKSRDIRRQTHVIVQNAPLEMRESFLRVMLRLSRSHVVQIRSEAYYCLGEITLLGRRRLIDAGFLIKGLVDSSVLVRACCANVLCHFVPLSNSTVETLRREIALHMHENVPRTLGAKLIYYASRTLHLHEETIQN